MIDIDCPKVFIGSKFTTSLGDQICITKLFNSGGQGDLFEVRDSVGDKKLCKIFHEKSNGLKERILFLIDLELTRSSKFITGPVDFFETPSLMGYVLPCIEDGKTLDQIFESEDLFDAVNGIVLALAVVKQLQILQSNGIGHGDLSSNNVLLVKCENIFKLHLIDLDNFFDIHSKSVSPCFGKKYYFAPEVMKQFLSGGKSYLTKESDMFSLGCLLHEILLLRPVIWAAKNEDEIQKILSEGWFDDPIFCRDFDGGYSSMYLTSSLNILLRRSLAFDPLIRPSLDEWEKTLKQSIHEVYRCESCDLPDIADETKPRRCPHCKIDYLNYKLKFCDPKIAEVKLQSYVTLGREQMSSPHVSKKHVALYPKGPSLRMRCFGRNGTYKFVGGDWVELPLEVECHLHTNDRLKFVDIEAQVLEIKG